MPAQRGQDLPAAFVSHIAAGVAEAAQDSEALLVFSGGQSRAAAGPRSEALSYWNVANHFDWWGTDVAARAALEEHARDSFENLLFSLCRFREVTGRYPESVSVVGYDFKQRRFSELHRAAVKLRQDQFHYVGVSPDPNSRFDPLAAAKVRPQTPLILSLLQSFGTLAPKCRFQPQPTLARPPFMPTLLVVSKTHATKSWSRSLTLPMHHDMKARSSGRALSGVVSAARLRLARSATVLRLVSRM